MSLIAAAALALAVPPAPPVPVVTTGPSPARPKITTLTPGDVTCSGERMVPLHIEMPLPNGLYPPQQDPDATLTFDIAPDGRPTRIAFEGPRTSWVRPDLRDLQPALAAWRFAPAARTSCRVRFDVQSLDLSVVDPQIAYRYAALHGRDLPGYNAALSRAVFDRARGPGSDCARRPYPRRLVYPDFDRVAVRPGGHEYTWLGYDIDRSGKPVNVRVIGSSGNAELDRRTADAMRNSRFEPKPKRGCIHYLARGASEPLPAAPVTDLDPFRPEGSNCHAGQEPEWKRPPTLTFPADFRRREIEGWAIVRFDVAPWGQIGNVKVVAAEPASLFGDQAVQVVSGASKVESNTGYSGCIRRVVFLLRDEDNAAEE